MLLVGIDIHICVNALETQKMATPSYKPHIANAPPLPPHNNLLKSIHHDYKNSDQKIYPHQSCIPFKIHLY